MESMVLNMVRREKKISDQENLPDNAVAIRDSGLVPGSGRSPGEENDYPLQYSCLENPIDRGTWWATIGSIGLQRVRWLPLKQLSILFFIHVSQRIISVYSNGSDYDKWGKGNIILGEG